MANSIITAEASAPEQTSYDELLDAPIKGVTPVMVAAGAKMAVEVFRGKITEEDACLWVGEIYAAMRRVT